MNKKLKYMACFLSFAFILMGSTVLVLSNSFLKKSLKTLSYTYPLMDIPALIKEADVIVKGEVNKIFPSKYRKITKYVIGKEEGKKLHEICKHTKEAFVVLNSEDDVEDFLNDDVGWVYTQKMIKVNKYLKNDLNKHQITVREDGGEYNGKVTAIDDEAPLKVGDEVILFLTKGHGGDYIILGGSQGKYFVKGNMITDDATETEISIADLQNQIENYLAN